ncbi:MAG: GNAT family N-acetyltransferase [Candidatus Saccharimonadales bacterium]
MRNLENLPEIELTDGVVSLKPFQLADAPAHLAGEDEEQVKWLGEGNKSTQQIVESWIVRNQKSWVEGGPVFSFAVRTVADDQQIGQVEVKTKSDKPGDFEPGEANVSYSLYPAGRGRGLATRAVTLLEPFMREKGVKRALIRVDPENKASLSVPPRCGYTEQGIIHRKDETLVSFSKELS